MKCPACGGQLGLEDVVCPYCGTPNTQAIQHQNDMARYHREYQNTQADVLAKTSFMQRNSSWLVILVVLLAALVAGVILNANAWDIGYSIRTNNVESSAAQDWETMDSYLEQGDYSQFLGYYTANDISLNHDDPYQVLRTAASAYVDIVHYVGEINNPESSSYNLNSTSHVCEYLAKDLNRIYTVEQLYTNHLDEYLPADKVKYLDDIRDRTAAIAKTYFGMSDEDVEEIPNMSERKLASIIEKGIAK